MARQSFVTTRVGVRRQNSALLISNETCVRYVVPRGVRQIARLRAELCGSRATATLTATFGLVQEAQSRGEPVAWITLPSSTFFPPDAAAGGIDLDSLAVVRTEPRSQVTVGSVP